MLEKVREFLRGPYGKLTAIVIAVLMVGFLIWSLRENFGAPDAAALTRSRVYICSETGKTFEVDVMKSGTKVPAHSPYSGKDTGYPAELCFWTKDGKPKRDPTYVLLNQYKGIKDPTFCPDCGRLVTADNPGAYLGATPPPTKAEYKPPRGAR
jgi:hypothetical protein